MTKNIDGNVVEDEADKIVPEMATMFEKVERKYFTMTEFMSEPVASHLENGKQTPCKVYLPHSPDATREKIEAMTAYQNWLTRLLQNLALQDKPGHVFHNNPVKLKSIDLQAPTWFGKEGTKLGFLKAQCTIETDDGKSYIPGAVFLRGGSVGMLIIIQQYDGEAEEKKRLVGNREPELYSILVIQPRVAAGSLAFAEIPAGMVDDDGSFSGTAAREIEEEVGITIKSDDIFNMSEAAVKGISQQPYVKLDDNTPSESVSDAMYPSVGGCDEFMPLMLAQKRMTKAKLEALKGAKTGLREEGEHITVKVVPFRDLWRHGGRDAKCLAALGLYENLKRNGMLPSMPAAPDSDA